MKLLIVGANGKIGMQVADQLHSWNILPSVGVRDVAKAERYFGERVRYHEVDFQRPETFAPALVNVDRLFFIAPVKEPQLVRQFLSEAAGAGVKRVVFSSGRTTGDLPGSPLNLIEQYVRESGIPTWTILRPGWFMQNFCDWLSDGIRKEDKIALPAGEAATAFVDVRDVAAVAIHALLEGGHDGKIYEVTSNEALTHRQVTALLSEALERPISYEPQTDDEFIKLMTDRGWTRERAERWAYLYRFVREGKEAAVSPDAGIILKREPRRFSDFIQDYKYNWKNSEAGYSFSDS